jgi:hypothetical protein
MNSTLRTFQEIWVFISPKIFWRTCFVLYVPSCWFAELTLWSLAAGGPLFGGERYVRVIKWPLVDPLQSLFYWIVGPVEYDRDFFHLLAIIINGAFWFLLVLPKLAGLAARLWRSRIKPQVPTPPPSAARVETPPRPLR